LFKKDTNIIRLLNNIVRDVSAEELGNQNKKMNKLFDKEGLL